MYLQYPAIPYHLLSIPSETELFLICRCLRGNEEFAEIILTSGWYTMVFPDPSFVYRRSEPVHSYAYSFFFLVWLLDNLFANFYLLLDIIN